MQLYNSLTKQLERVEPNQGKVRIYSCGPTVYERAHIGNLASFIYADTLRRALEIGGNDVEHVMNITDVDDKTISRSREQYPGLEPMEALKKLTSHYEKLFMNDLVAVGVDVEKIKFVRATDNIEAMQKLIAKLLAGGVAYITGDGIYFSIDEYKKRGKTYGQLVDIEPSSMTRSRIDNDEYDKDSPQDFALWKAQKPGEPAWDLEIDGTNIAGRPGWHIECSAMSTKYLGQPFEIHTGGVDLKFPHHENEIAQSTALNGEHLAKLFFHSEHMLIDNQKMSKSLNNFLSLEDIKDKGFDPLAFRLLVLQSQYNNQSHFSWENLKSAQNRLEGYCQMADVALQPGKAGDIWDMTAEQSGLVFLDFESIKSKLLDAIEEDLNMPEVLKIANSTESDMLHFGIEEDQLTHFTSLLKLMERLLGLGLLQRADITTEQKLLVAQREEARRDKDFAKSDELRNQLEKQGIGLNDTPDGSVWYRL